MKPTTTTPAQITERMDAIEAETAALETFLADTKIINEDHTPAEGAALRIKRAEAKTKITALGAEFATLSHALYCGAELPAADQAREKALSRPVQIIKARLMDQTHAGALKLAEAAGAEILEF